MMKALVVVDMQNDFITGSLANEEAQKIVPLVADYIRNFDGDIIFTQDTHYDEYLNSQEGRKLPVEHCILNTWGWEVEPEIYAALKERILKGVPLHVENVEKNAFGSPLIGELAAKYSHVEFIGVCTDICVISNVMVAKSYAPETEMIVHKNMCAGTTLENHECALKVMASCQVQIV